MNSLAVFPDCSIFFSGKSELAYDGTVYPPVEFIISNLGSITRMVLRWNQLFIDGVTGSQLETKEASIEILRAVYVMEQVDFCDRWSCRL